MTDAETTTALDPVPETGSAVRMPRSRGAVSGVLLMLAGIWGAFVPFVGPYFDFAYTPKPDQTWHWTAARGWYEVLPGGVAFLGGLLLIVSANRIVAGLGAWIAALAGGWFVVGQQVSFLLTLGSPGAPAAQGDRRYVAEYLAFFTGLGAVIILVSAVAIGRLSVRSVRDARAAARREHEATLAEQQAAELQTEYERSDADRAATDRHAETWAAGQYDRGYGTPGSEAAPDVADHGSSAVTTELPAAGATAAGAIPPFVAEDEHAAFRRSPEHPIGPDDDTAALPVVPEPEPEPEPESEAPPPLVLEPPEGHPDALRLKAPSEQPEPSPPAEVPPAEVDESSAEQPPTASAWNPEAQSPTTTGELPALGSTSPPPPVAAPYRRGIQQPRRYFGPGNPAPADDVPAPPVRDASSATAPQRDAVRTDESIDQDLDNEMDLDDRPR